MVVDLVMEVAEGAMEAEVLGMETRVEDMVAIVMEVMEEVEEVHLYISVK